MGSIRDSLNFLQGKHFVLWAPASLCSQREPNPCAMLQLSRRPLGEAKRHLEGDRLQFTQKGR
ncbi:MAG: hypothetical protein ACREPR_15785 [Brasilonema sp.]